MRHGTQLSAVLEDVKKESVKIYGQKLNKIILFGSYARGDDTDQSDVDIMILLNCDADEVRSLHDETVEMASNISLDREVFVSIKVREQKHFDEYSGILPFYQNIMREGVEVYGTKQNC